MYVFVPMVAETTGIWDAGPAIVLRHVARAVAARSGEEAGPLYSTLIQELSITICSYRARAALRRRLAAAETQKVSMGSGRSADTGVPSSKWQKLCVWSLAFSSLILAFYYTRSVALEDAPGLLSKKILTSQTVSLGLDLGFVEGLVWQHRSCNWGSLMLQFLCEPYWGCIGCCHFGPFMGVLNISG